MFDLHRISVQTDCVPILVGIQTGRQADRQGDPARTGPSAAAARDAQRRRCSGRAALIFSRSAARDARPCRSRQELRRHVRWRDLPACTSANRLRGVALRVTDEAHRVDMICHSCRLKVSLVGRSGPGIKSVSMVQRHGRRMHIWEARCTVLVIVSRVDSTSTIG